MQKLGDHLIQTVDTVPFSEPVSSLIVGAFREAGFKAVDRGHHILIQAPEAIPQEWECACLYLSDPYTVYVKAMARRWWLLWTGGDHHQRFDRFWTVMDTLESQLDYLKFVQGTVGEFKN